MMSNINAKEIKNIKENIIDIRSIEKYNSNHIPNAINIPVEKILLNSTKYLEKNKQYYIYCQKGLTSYNICKILSQQGYNVININGGYESWLLNQ